MQERDRNIFAAARQGKKVEPPRRQGLQGKARTKALTAEAQRKAITAKARRRKEKPQRTSKF
jgi:hypothetical protein